MSLGVDVLGTRRMKLRARWLGFSAVCACAGLIGAAGWIWVRPRFNSGESAPRSVPSSASVHPAYPIASAPGVHVLDNIGPSPAYLIDCGPGLVLIDSG